MTHPPPIRLTPHLAEERHEDAVRLVRTYFAGILEGAGGFEGAWWDGFDPSGTRAENPNTFTADDILSASLLSAPISQGPPSRFLARRPTS